MPVRTPTPSLSQVRNWDTLHLTDAAHRWTSTAGIWECTFNDVATNISRPGGTVWQGVAAEDARQRAHADRIAASGLADHLNKAADIARRGADQIGYAKAKVLEAVDAAEAAGFAVREDFSVFSTAARQAQARVLAADIRTRVGQLVGLDYRVATGIDSATAGLDSRLVDFKQAPADSPSDSPEPGGGYGSYHYGYQFSTGEGWTKEQIMSEVQKHFNYYFTFTADTGELVKGAKLNLDGPFGEDEPVQVTGIGPDSFSFVSLPGHNEGAGRVIKFSIVPAADNPVPGRLNWELRVAASGPLSKGSLIPGASWLNKGIWQVFADNLDSKLPTRPTQPGLVAF
jgi:hypothetical protein